MIRNPTDMLQLQQQSGTANNATLAVSTATFGHSGLAAALLAASLAFAASGEPIAQVQSAIAIERPSTVGQFGNVFSRSYDQDENLEFEGAIARFYSKLLNDQEPLGQQFEQVLHANLWDLYVRS
jgi:hypothetical protein